MGHGSVVAFERSFPSPSAIEVDESVRLEPGLALALEPRRNLSKVMERRQSSEEGCSQLEADDQFRRLFRQALGHAAHIEHVLEHRDARLAIR
jgi:hypothetical protein